MLPLRVKRHCELRMLVFLRPLNREFPKRMREEWYSFLSEFRIKFSEIANRAQGISTPRSEFRGSRLTWN